MNEITSRFAAMAARAAAEEQKPRRLPGESGQAALDRRVQEELDSLAVESQQPPSVAALSGPQSGRAFSRGPASDTPRARAVAYVERLIAGYQFLRRSSYGYKVNVTAVIDNLRRELALMMVVGPEGERLARRWDLLCGDLV